MAYEISYEQIGNIPKRRKKLPVCLAGALIALLVISAIAIKTVSLEWVQEVLLPGDPHVTAAALDDMLNSLRNGEDVVSVIQTFCLEILENAQPS